jgi:hypothetical protein
VLVPRGDSLRDFSIERFAARPRAFTPDPDAPDISITAGERRGLGSLPTGLVQCRVVPIDAGRAALLYADGAGTYLREVLPLSSLEERLRDAREIVRAATPPAVLAMRLSDGVEPAVRRAGPPGPRVEVAVRGALPFVEIEIGGERFGGTSPLGWGAAAEALLARCPAGAEPVVAVDAVTATVRGRLAVARALRQRGGHGVAFAPTSPGDGDLSPSIPHSLRVCAAGSRSRSCSPSRFHGSVSRLLVPAFARCCRARRAPAPARACGPGGCRLTWPPRPMREVRTAALQRPATAPCAGLADG